MNERETSFQGKKKALKRQQIPGHSLPLTSALKSTPDTLAFKAGSVFIKGSIQRGKSVKQNRIMTYIKTISSHDILKPERFSTEGNSEIETVF